MEQTNEAIRYAEASLPRNDSPMIAARVCEEMLLGTGRQEAASALDALAAATATDRVQETRTQIRGWIDARDTDAFVKEQMGRHFHALPGS